MTNWLLYGGCEGEAHGASSLRPHSSRKAREGWCTLFLMVRAGADLPPSRFHNSRVLESSVSDRMLVRSEGCGFLGGPCPNLLLPLIYRPCPRPRSCRVGRYAPTFSSLGRGLRDWPAASRLRNSGSRWW